MSSVTYNIPVHLVADYRGRQVVVRLKDFSDVVQKITEEDFANIQYVQLLSTGIDPLSIVALANWGRAVPLDILIRDPVSEFPHLYNFSKLLDKHPIRVTIAVKPGFSKAVRLALALNFTVKLDVEQPEDALIAEMAEVLEFYLHRPNVSQPVEYFHSIFIAGYRNEPTSVWLVQEEDPELFRFVTDDGVETLSPRFAGIEPDQIGSMSGKDGNVSSRNGAIECDTCEYMEVCGGYFKWPDKSYSCNGIKSIFATINSAANDLNKDLLAFTASHGGAQP